jgi:hypothetical protein
MGTLVAITKIYYYLSTLAASSAQIIFIILRNAKIFTQEKTNYFFQLEMFCEGK